MTEGKSEAMTTPTIDGKEAAAREAMSISEEYLNELMEACDSVHVVKFRPGLGVGAPGYVSVETGTLKSLIAASRSLASRQVSGVTEEMVNAAIAVGNSYDEGFDSHDRHKGTAYKVYRILDGEPPLLVSEHEDRGEMEAALTQARTRAALEAALNLQPPAEPATADKPEPRGARE